MRHVLGRKCVWFFSSCKAVDDQQERCESGVLEEEGQELGLKPEYRVHP